MTWILFIAVAALIIFAGSKLSALAEKLAEEFHISSSAVGLLLVSIVTSLPELSTSLGAVLKVGEPNLAVGNTLGSDLFNLMIIALCDLIFRKKGILRQTARHIKPLLYYMIMLTGILLTLTLPNNIHLLGFNFNIGSVLIAAFYITMFVSTHKGEQAKRDNQPIHPGAWKTALLFALMSAVIIVAGTLLAKLGDQIAEQTGLEQSFVGSLLLALATSLPELTVSISAVRIGAYDLMVGNIIGSNMFNVFIGAIADMAYRSEALHIPTNLDRGLLLIGLCVGGAAVATLAGMRQRKKARFIAWESIVTMALYLTGLYALFRG